jgi:superfamily II DNA or RNA helicase
VSATFETYWNDIEFETCTSDGIKKMRDALAGERKSGDSDDAKDEIYFDLHPYAFQQEILDRIQAGREVSGRTNHLIVAATGTGKTIIAAFDFKRWRKDFMSKNKNREPRFLFVAHREEILRQSLTTFRQVLRDFNFGGMMVNGIVPSHIEQLFISIQSYNSKQFSDMLDAEHYDYVVIDEFHHSAADTYKYLLEHLKPKALLGLTATPERADGKDIIEKHFGGHISAEIRLPDAINRKLLSPFQYFCVSDAVDYSTLKWQRGGYVSADLDNLISANDIRANLVISQVREKLLDHSKARGIGFCVSQKHAEFMSKKFNAAGIKSGYLTADSPAADRRAVKHKLSSHEINFIFTVDLFNEGVDIPELDTVLFLRPTESLTVYLQQLGRGLRLYEDKECLTVLDFVGQAHKNFRFDLRFKALLAVRNRPLDEEIEAGLPYLPAGCTFHLEKKAKEYILENIRQSIRICRHAEILRKISSFYEDTGKKLSLENFKDYYQLDFYDIYKRATWSRLCREASGGAGDFNEPDEERLQKGFGRISHIDDCGQIDFLIDVLSNGARDSLYTGDISRRRLLMAYFTLLGKAPGSSEINLADGLNRLLMNKSHIAELIDLLKYNRDRIDHLPENIALPYPCPLQLHACYTRDEILAALGVWTPGKQKEVREGVKYDGDIKTDIFFITLNKNERSYSPTTMYKDYAISDTLFHWQSQSTTAAESPTGRRYINQRAGGGTVLLFVRENEKVSGGHYSSPFYYLGPADYVSHTGSKPINIIWKLRAPMPAKLLRQTARLAVV